MSRSLINVFILVNAFAITLFRKEFFQKKTNSFGEISMWTILSSKSGQGKRVREKKFCHTYFCF